MPTRKTIFWLTGALVMYLIAWNIGSGWLYLLAALLIAFPLASLILSRANTRNLELELFSPGEAGSGGTVNATLFIRNRSRLPRFFLSLDCSLGGGRQRLFVPTVRGRETCRLETRFSGLKRGVYPGGTALLASSAPLGLVRSRRSYAVASPLTVYPAWQRLAGDWNGDRRETGHAASSTSPSRCSAGDYLGVRDYRPEDSPRSIHWRTTARSNRLAVVEYARQTMVTPVFIVDNFRGTGDAGEEVFEVLVNTTTSLLKREEEHGHRFGLGHSPADAAGRKLGYDTGAAMLWLSGIQADGSRPLELEDGLPWSHAMPVLLLASHRDYAHIHRSAFFQRHPRSLVIMVDGRRIAGGGNGFMDESRLAALGERLHARGCRFLTIETDEDLRPCLEPL